MILSVLQLPSAPSADGDMSKLTPDFIIKKDGDIELEFFGRIINPALKANLTIGLNGLELCQFEQMQAHALGCLEQIFTCPLPLTAAVKNSSTMDFYLHHVSSNT